MSSRHHRARENVWIIINAKAKSVRVTCILRIDCKRKVHSKLNSILFCWLTQTHRAVMYWNTLKGAHTNDTNRSENRFLCVSGEYWRKMSYAVDFRNRVFILFLRCCNFSYLMSKWIISLCISPLISQWALRWRRRIIQLCYCDPKPIATQMEWEHYTLKLTIDPYKYHTLVFLRHLKNGATNNAVEKYLDYGIDRKYWTIHVAPPQSQPWETTVEWDLFKHDQHIIITSSHWVSGFLVLQFSNCENDTHTRAHTHNWKHLEAETLKICK